MLLRALDDDDDDDGDNNTSNNSNNGADDDPASGAEPLVQRVHHACRAGAVRRRRGAGTARVPPPSPPPPRRCTATDGDATCRPRLLHGRRSEWRHEQLVAIQSSVASTPADHIYAGTVNGTVRFVAAAVVDGGGRG